MRRLLLLLVLLCPGLGLAADARLRRRHLLALLGFACALAQCSNAVAAGLQPPRMAHAAVALGCWALPIFVGVRQRRRSIAKEAP